MPLNDDGKLDGVYAYLYTALRDPQKFYGRICGNMMTVGCGSAEEAEKTRLTLRVSQYDIQKVKSGRWMRPAEFAAAEAAARKANTAPAEDGWDDEKLRRKVDQSWELAGCARVDGDRVDEARHTAEARRLQTLLRMRG